jgi:hypothetical protein
MKKLLFIFFIALIALSSCDGRERVYKSNVEVLSAAGLLKSFSEETHFIPEVPVTIYTDTILSSGFQIKIEYNTIENDYISKKVRTVNDSLINTNYQNFEAKLIVYKSEKFITKHRLNKNIFSTQDNSAFFQNAIMQFVWIDYDSSNDQYISLNTSFCIPETESCKDFNIKIDSFGIVEIEEINLTSQIL